jgi:phage terminase large subunit GpA-like protein
MVEYPEALKRTVTKFYSVFKPPPDLALSKWAEQNARLSEGVSHESGKWHSYPYQPGIMDAFTDPEIEQVTVKKSARVGYTKILNNVIGYHIDLDPCNILVVQPTVEDAEGYSKDEIATMCADTPCLDGKISDPRSRDGTNTVLKKKYPGGTLYMVGANSPRGFRRISARLVLFDEVSGYPPSAGTEGDQIELGKKRADWFWNKKFMLGSTPTIQGDCKIDEAFEDSDQRRFFVPCPHCNEKQYLKWANFGWPDGQPEKAYYICEHCGAIIEETEKRGMIDRGEWIATKEFNGNAGFHIWAAYSYSPGATWAKIALKSVEAKRAGYEKTKTFVNTWLGECFIEEAEQPAWELLLDRAEDYKSPAAGAYVLTAGVDVQKDRLEMSVEGWAPEDENWQVEYNYFYGDTSRAEVWNQLRAALRRTYLNDRGVKLRISATGLDTGYRTKICYSFIKKNAAFGVYALKGAEGGGRPLVDRAVKKKTGRDPRAVRLFIVGVDGAKSFIYHQLTTDEPGPGYRHFGKHLQREYYEGLTAEKKVTKKRRGFEFTEWHKTRPRNEPLDCAVYAMAALEILNPTWEVLTNTLPAPPAAQSNDDGRDTFASKSNLGFDR